MSSTSPRVKFEHSPAESFISMPGEMYPPLFGGNGTPQGATTVNPLDMLSPGPPTTPSSTAATDLAVLSALSASVGLPPTPEAPVDEKTAEKKPVKKRKSWGQVLPEPKTNLPPR